MATACLRPPSPLELPRFALSPAPAQVSTDCLADVRGSLWQRWASGPLQRSSRWERERDEIYWKKRNANMYNTWKNNIYTVSRQENKCTKTLCVLCLCSALVFDFMCVCLSGTLITGKHSKTGPKTQLYPRQLHGGGHGRLSWWAGHIFLCQSKAEKNKSSCYYVTRFIYNLIIILILKNNSDGILIFCYLFFLSLLTIIFPLCSF